MVRVFKFFLSIAISFSLSASALTIDEIKENLKKAEIYKVEYKQTKALSAANTTLASDGFIIVKKKSLVYIQQNPFDQILVMTDSRLLEIVDDDENEITKESNPEVFEISSLLLKVFSFEGDYTKYFDISLSGSLDNWKAQLKAKDENIQKIFKLIELTGSDHLNTLEIYDNNSDVTSLFFDNYVYENIQDETGVLKYLE